MHFGAGIGHFLLRCKIFQIQPFYFIVLKILSYQQQMLIVFLCIFLCENLGRIQYEMRT